jgi:hypothetical protein
MPAGMGAGLLSVLRPTGGRGRRGLGAGLRLIGRVIPRRLRLKILSAKCATVDRGGHA